LEEGREKHSNQPVYCYSSEIDADFEKILDKIVSNQVGDRAAPLCDRLFDLQKVLKAKMLLFINY
jgi:hypothetical protein